MKKEIYRNLRIDKPLDDFLKAVAEYEDRSISQVIRRLLLNSAKNYLKNPDFMKFYEIFDKNEMHEDFLSFAKNFITK